MVRLYKLITLKYIVVVKKNIFILGLISLLVVLSIESKAQRGWEVGLYGGSSWYFGDLNTNYDLSDAGLAGGLVLRYNFNPRVCFKLTGNIGNIEGSDMDSPNVYERARNLSFESQVIDGTAEIEFNFLNYIHGSKNEFFTPYLSAGLTIHHFNPKTIYEAELVELQPLGTEGQFIGEEYDLTKVGLAYGGGFKISLSYEWSLNLLISARHLFTDYLDDVSTVYADKGDIEQFHNELGALLSDRSISIDGVPAEEIGRPGNQRGDSTNKDSYVYVGLGVLYYFGDLKCPTYGSRKRRK